ncbi:CocE/NonD family hydrolase [Plantactinospora sp. ZYX-F-223]|uniref:CocE/NonD family hydrolase n=1 Tax=Plantactinospora sp. ZYX-F-223 TaxID=3144103 RepID=UPI0031FC70FC
MTVVRLLLQLRSLGVEIRVEQGKLRYSGPPGVLVGELLDRVRENRAAIIAFLLESDGVEHTTRHIPVRDGTLLALDLFRPRREGVTVTGALPVLWCLERYGRPGRPDQESRLDTHPWLRRVIAAGYVIASVDARGTGDSTGERALEFGPAELLDTYDVTEWLAEQSFCDGNVGMFGDSYSAVVQLLAASVAPPHLKAIFPQMAMHDAYAFLYPGGVFRHDFARRWNEMVDELQNRARSEDARPARGILSQSSALPFRDSVDEDSGVRLFEELSPARFAERISRSGIAICHLSGWYDMWVRDALTWFTNLSNPQRIIVGAWCHNDRSGIDLADEHIRWFDHWLRGVDHGLMDGPAIRYATIGRPRGDWRTATHWPLPDVVPYVLYLHAAPAGMRGGALSSSPAVDAAPSDRYAVDYSTTSGRRSRWANGYLTYGFGDERFGYDIPLDRPGLLYTTPPLPVDMTVTGHPVVTLVVSSTHDDGDFFVYLEEVDALGQPHYVTEGVLRASHRAEEPSPHAFMGLPYHPGTQASVAPLNGRPAVLRFDLHPTSKLFPKGSRIRLVVTCCDRDNAETPMVTPAPVIDLYCREPFLSMISLPVERRAFRAGGG